MKYTAHSESGLGNVYVLAVAEVTDDEVAPEITATLPAQNAVGVSASGSITISYNERIQAGNTEKAAMLNDKELQPVWNTRSVTFNYNMLTYGATYTFTLPAGYVTDRSGNAAEALTLTFTVMDKQKPEPRIFDAVVDKSLNLQQGQSIPATATMPKQYRYIQDAIDDAPSNATQPYLIFIKEG